MQRSKFFENFEVFQERCYKKRAIICGNRGRLDGNLKIDRGDRYWNRAYILDRKQDSKYFAL